MQETHNLLQASLATGTWVSYRRCIVNFIEFRSQFGLEDLWPVPEAHILLFISFLSVKNFAPSTINSHIAALSFVHNVNGWGNPTDSFLVRKVKEGCRRSNRRSDERLPITPVILEQLIRVLPAICKSGYECQLFKAAFLLAFFGFLRVGELASTRNNTDLNRLISVNDVSISGSSLELRIRFSKTDQRGHSYCIYIEGSRNQELCPVNALSIYLKSRPSKGGPLFIHFNGQVISSYQFTHVLKEGIKVLGLCPNSFGSHSFRIGAATSVAINGFPEETIKSLGRWKSASFKLYIRRPSVMLPS